jgi:hypothetical protein
MKMKKLNSFILKRLYIKGIKSINCVSVCGMHQPKISQSLSKYKTFNKMKVVITIIGLLLCCNLIGFDNVFAQNPPLNDESDQQVWGYDPTMNDIISSSVNYELVDEYIDKAEFPIMQKGYLRSGVIDQAWAVNQIVKYNQRDSRWANTRLGGCTSDTIGTAGCALTSFTMALTYNGRFNVNPLNVNSTLGTKACAFDANYSAGKYSMRANILAASPQYEEPAKKIIRGGLKSLKPVMVGMKKVDGSGSHFVLVYGFEQYGSNSFLHFIYDPEGKNDYATLEDYMVNWYITRIYTFQ